MKELIAKLLKWSLSTKILSLPRSVLWKVVVFHLKSKRAVIVSFNDSERRNTFDLICRVKREADMLLEDNEAYQVFMVVKRTEKIKGELAEVGVYKGGSAKLICEAKGDRILHLFDTFEGLPNVGENDAHIFKNRMYAASLEAVRNYLKSYPNVHCYKGVFPDTTVPIRLNNFSFVNLDVDTYRSTLDCLEFFYPRMEQGGIIMSHDYIYAHGVKKAFDEFFANKIEVIIELSGSQVLIVKL